MTLGEERNSKRGGRADAQANAVAVFAQCFSARSTSGVLPDWTARRGGV